MVSCGKLKIFGRTQLLCFSSIFMNFRFSRILPDSPGFSRNSPGSPRSKMNISFLFGISLPHGSIHVVIILQIYFRDILVLLSVRRPQIPIQNTTTRENQCILPDSPGFFRNWPGNIKSSFRFGISSPHRSIHIVII